MGISPIPGIRSLPVTKAQRADGEVSRVFDIENSSRADDDTYSGSDKKGAGGQSHEEVPPEETALLNDDTAGEGTEDSAQVTESRLSREETGSDQSAGVNYFA